MLRMTQLIGSGAGGVPPSRSYVGRVGVASVGTVYTFNTTAIGAADPGRVVVLAVQVFQGSNAGVIASVTVNAGGTTPAINVNSGGGTFVNNCALVPVAVPTGTTANIVVTSGVSLRLPVGDSQ